MRYSRYFNCSFFCSLTKVFFDSFTIFYIFSWFLIRGFRQAGEPIPILNNWLTDFVFVPLLVHFSYVFSYYLKLNNEKRKYPLYQIITISLYTSLVFEWLAPIYSNYNTADWIDVIMYFAGGFFYYYIHQPYALKNLVTKSNHI